MANVSISDLYTANPLTAVVDPNLVIWPVSDLSEATPATQAKGVSLAFFDDRYAGAGTYLTVANNLSDLADVATARGSLGLGSAAIADATDFATAAQGVLADSAVQPGDLAAVAYSGDYGDLSGSPTLGALAAENWPASDGQEYVAKNGAWAVATGGGGGSSLPVVDETAIVYKTGQPTYTVTLDANALTAARTKTLQNTNATLAELETAQTFTAAQKINVNSTTAFFVERDGVKDNVLVVDTTNGKIGVGVAPTKAILEIDGTTTGTGTEPDAICYIRQQGSWTLDEPWALYVVGYSYLNGFRVNASDGVRALYRITSGQLGLATSDNVSDITFTTNVGVEQMRIQASTNRIAMGINLTSPLAKLHVDQSVSTANIPVLILDQADVDVVLAKIIGTSSATNVDRTLVKASDYPTPGSIAAWVQIAVQDDRSGGITAGDYYLPIYSAPS